LVLLAYLDEFGHIGPYISLEHRKYNQHPAFGYAGFVVPASNVREFGASFEHFKERQFRAAIRESGANPHGWERKGAEMFTTGSFNKYPENMEMVSHLVQRLHQLGGRTYFYGQVKPVGSEKETGESARARNGHALQQSLIWLAAYADAQNERLLVFVDRTDRAVREAAIDDMAKAIYGKLRPELSRIVQVPTELESHRYGTIQFADWLAAAVSRASHYHLAYGSEFSWAPAQFRRIFADSAIRQSRIWLRDEKEKVTVKALGKTQPWREFSAAKKQADRHRQFSHRIDDYDTGLRRIRNQLEACRMEGT